MVSRLSGIGAVSLHTESSTMPAHAVALIIMEASDQLSHQRLHELVGLSLPRLARLTPSSARTDARIHHSITRAGSRCLRTDLVELAWRLLLYPLPRTILLPRKRGDGDGPRPSAARFPSFQSVA